jgi:hypothetical protein
MDVKFEILEYIYRIKKIGAISARLRMTRLGTKTTILTVRLLGYVVDI